VSGVKSFRVGEFYGAHEWVWLGFNDNYVYGIRIIIMSDEVRQRIGKG
jgi:hypothetical protein